MKTIARYLFWTILLGVLAAAIAWKYLQRPPIAVTVDTVRRGEVIETVAAITTGAVVPTRHARVAAGTVGVVRQVHVTEGQQVRAGDLVVELEHAELDAQLALAEANLEVGRTRLIQAEEGAKAARDVAEIEIRRATTALEQAEVDYNRVRELLDKSVISRSDYDRALLALKTARDARAAAEAGRREADVKAKEVDVARAGVIQFEAARDAAAAVREKAFARAPFDGVVTKVMVHAGESVIMGMPLVYLVDPRDFRIEAPFDEANLASLRPGQEAIIQADSYPGRTFKGVLDFVAPAVAQGEQIARNLPCKIRVVDSPELFIPGMSADVLIITERRQDTLYVPSESLVRDEYAYVVRGGVARRRDVKVGVGNIETKEILEGLSEGETIVTSLSVKGLEDGVAVQVVKELPQP